MIHTAAAPGAGRARSAHALHRRKVLGLAAETRKAYAGAKVRGRHGCDWRCNFQKLQLLCSFLICFTAPRKRRRRENFGTQDPLSNAQAAPARPKQSGISNRRLAPGTQATAVKQCSLRPREAVAYKTRLPVLPLIWVHGLLASTEQHFHD